LTLSVCGSAAKEAIMTQQGFTASAIQLLLVGLFTVTPAFGQGGRGGRGMMGDGAHAADMQVLHQLFEHRTEISRQVLTRENGVETVTESKNPEVTTLLQTHVVSMLARVKEERPIHQRDPLFAELFRYADRIEAKYERTARGVRVIETSDDPYVVKLLQAHADVVSAFIANGHSEAMKNHPVPPRQPAQPSPGE
jgi:hypothetical protein